MTPSTHDPGGGTAARTTVADAVAGIADGADVYIGGAADTRPMAAVHALAAAGRSGLTVRTRAPLSALAPLFDAGCVARLHTDRPEQAPAGVRAALAARDVLAAQLRAGAAGLTFALIPPDAAAGADTAPMRCPFTGTEAAAVPALRPDAVLLHGESAGTDGTVRLAQGSGGAGGLDALAAAAGAGGGAVLATVEQIVSAEALADAPAGALLPAGTATAVAEVPFGAHPTALPGRYRADPDPAPPFGGDWGGHLDALGPYRLFGLATGEERA